MLLGEFSVFTRRLADEPIWRIRSEVNPLFYTYKKNDHKVQSSTKIEEKNLTVDACH